MKVRQVASLGTGLQSIDAGNGLRIELKCDASVGTSLFRIRSNSDNNVVQVNLSAEGTRGTPNDSFVGGFGTTDASFSGADDDFDINEALDTGGGVEGAGDFVFSSTTGAVITGNYMVAFNTTQGDCVLVGQTTTTV